jgi:integrase
MSSLKIKTYKGRPYYYLRGTIKANRKRARIFESTGIRVGSANALSQAKELRLRREAEILEELISGKRKDELTWIEIAALYCREHALRRISKRPELAGTIDPEAGYVLRLTDFLKTRRLADRPVGALKYEDIQAYFNDGLQGKELSYLHRCRNSYRAVMNWAVENEHCSPGFPMPELPEYDPRKIAVNKNLALEIIDLFIQFAPPHAKMLFQTMFETGLRGGELLFLNRTPPEAKRPRRSGLCLEEGKEHIYLGVTKDGKAMRRIISSQLANALRAYVGERTDAHDTLFLTDKGVPYQPSKTQRGAQYRRAWNSTREKVLQELKDRLNIAQAEGNKARQGQLAAWIAECEHATGHWSRHSMISRAVLQGVSDRMIMSLSGHRSPQMIARYAHLRDDDARILAEQTALPLPSGPMTPTPKPAKRKKTRRSA